MTITEQLRIEGKIETYKELLASDLLPKELAEKKIKEMIQELKKKSQSISNNSHGLLEG